MCPENNLENQIKDWNSINHRKCLLKATYTKLTVDKNREIRALVSEYESKYGMCFNPNVNPKEIFL